MPQKLSDKLILIARTVDYAFHSFIVGQCLEAIISGVLCTIGMVLLGLPYAPMVGTLIGVTALIPVVGAYVGGGIGAFLIFTVAPTKALIFLIYLVILQQVEGNLIYPRVVGSSLGLPGIWVLAAVTIGGGGGRNTEGTFGCSGGRRLLSAAEEGSKKKNGVDRTGAIGIKEIQICRM